MEPQNIRFGGGAAETMLSPLVAVWMLIAIVLILAFPRKKAITPFLLAVFTIPIGQVVVLGGLHFTVLRILILAGLARVATFRGSSSGGKFPGGFNAVDRMVVLWTVSALIILSLQWMDMQALIHNLGDFLDALGGYMVVRFLIPDGEAIRRTIKVLAVICAIQGACMINEQITHVNVFGLLGGTWAGVTVRDGKIRSEGVMGCIPAGVFAGASIAVVSLAVDKTKVPDSSLRRTCRRHRHGDHVEREHVVDGRWRERRGAGLLASAQADAARSLGICAHSGGAAPGDESAGVVADRPRGPDWVLFERPPLLLWWTTASGISATGGSSDTGITTIGDGTCGIPATSLLTLPLKGGLLTLVCYIAIFSRSFGAIGTARKQVNRDRAQEWLLWCLGADLFANVVASFGINYSGPLLMSLFPLLACISVASFEAKQTSVRSVESPDQERFAFAPGGAGTDRPLDESREEARHSFFEA